MDNFKFIKRMKNFIKEAELQLEEEEENLRIEQLEKPKKKKLKKIEDVFEDKKFSKHKSKK